MISMLNIGWLAALLEGEGHFGYMAYTPRVDLWMCDRDVIERAATLIGKKVSSRSPKGRPQWKPIYGFTVCGAQALGVMFTVYTLLGVRRREQINCAVRLWTAPRLSRAEHNRRLSVAQKIVAAKRGPAFYRDMARKGSAKRWGYSDPRTGELFG
jgi:hypothetical protein